MNDDNALIAPPDKYFYTVDGKILTNIHQLSEYIKNCSNEHFQHHVSSARNDFYNWIADVFGISGLAKQIRDNYDKKSVADIINQFIVETEKTEKEAQSKEEVKKDATTKQQEENTAIAKKEREKVVEKTEETSTLQSAPQPVANEQNDGKFKEFSDEELEKFTKFGVKDTETPANEKLDYLKTELNELRSMIKELRKTGKDMIIADLILRVVEPKMAFYEYTKSQDDYERIIQVLNDARREIDYASQQTESTVADEVIKQLDLQRIMLRKDFTPKKTGVLGKIFKQSR